ncbi:PucR family transcriptional regulator [Nocardioides pelophilus]|uniref:PucR family transcriptional regulator n=1 Tax=Nocardioides pelophilus TaxID=2172019 RepID=UPI00160449E6|nr:PucR family transcriptional regulator [Nocardioides pelophilus]
MEQPDEAVAAWIRTFAVESLASEEVDRVVRLLDEQIAAQVAVIARDPDLRAALDASTRAQLRSFVTHLVNPGELRPPDEAFLLAREFAARGVELASLLEVYRSGQQAALAYVTSVAKDAALAPAQVTGALVTVWGQAIEWFAHSVEQLIGAYGEERERWLRSALTRRTQLVASILDGDRVDIDEAGRDLGHSLRRHQTALVLWEADARADGDAVPRLEAEAARLAARCAAPRPLVLQAGPAEVWAWLATDRPPDAGGWSAEVTPGVRVAVGVTAPGVAGFRDSHREAVAARALADVLPDPLVAYADVEVVSLLSRDRSAMETFVRRELGDLAADDAATARLRATALAYLEVGMEGAAARLAIHRNTVRYRLHQAEGLLGHPITERRRELELALLCADTHVAWITKPRRQ